MTVPLLTENIPVTIRGVVLVYLFLFICSCLFVLVYLFLFICSCFPVTIGPLKQIVPQYQSLKNNYTLLWDMPSNRGYIHIVAVMQKFFDQAISGNWSYNPENYPDNEVPTSVMAQDLLTTYKYGWKTSYYQNTHDMKNDEVEETRQSLENLVSDTLGIVTGKQIGRAHV